MTTSPSPAIASPSSSNGACGSSLPRWRLWLSMLNWRRDPDYERKLALIERSIALTESSIASIERSIATSEQRLQDSEQSIQDSKQRMQDSERRLKLIESETEQLREQNARGRQLLSQIDALCFPDASSSIPAPPTAIDSVPSSR
jgi:septal ring factor EnvC (AmiA/AmiB activator)